jgi:hypothetical protein
VFDQFVVDRLACTFLALFGEVLNHKGVNAPPDDLGEEDEAVDDRLGQLATS